MTLHVFSENIAKSIQTHSDRIDESQIDQMRYAIETLLSECSKLILLILFFTYWGQLQAFLYAFVFFSISRIFSGGLHFSTYWRCLLGTLVLYSLMIWIPPINSLITKTVVVGFSMIMTLIFAPITDIKRPITHRRKRIRSKLLTLIIISVLLVLFHHKTILFSTLVVFGIQLMIGGIIYEIKQKHL